MSYWLRALCPEPHLPTPQSIIDLGEEHGVLLRVSKLTPVDLSSTAWKSLLLLFEEGKENESSPMNLVDARHGDDAQEEIEDFRELLGPVRSSRGKRRVAEHLDRTQLIVGVQLSMGGEADSALAAAQVVIEKFVRDHGALVQADEEGFYEGARLILKLR